MVRNRLEDLLAVWTTALIHQAAPGSESKPFILPGSAVEPHRANEKIFPIESLLELYHLPAEGTAVHQTGRTDVLFYRHRQLKMTTPQKVIQSTAHTPVPLPYAQALSAFPSGTCQTSNASPRGRYRSNQGREPRSHAVNWVFRGIVMAITK
jgi:hypothetical protein